MGQLWVDEANPTNLIGNPYAWTNISSMLFIEAPACVGYSYADTLDGCAHNDSSQAVDNYEALQQFFVGFPEFADNDFYITGESYAGIYVPTLAQQVVRGAAKINLKGIAVGNGCLGLNIGTCAFDYKNELNSNMPYFAGHGLIAPTTYAAVVKDCDPAAATPSAACSADFDAAHGEIGRVNIYNIYGPCVTGSAGALDAAGRRVHSRAPVPVRSDGPVECIDETLAKYVGRADVAAALHVFPLNWAACGSNSSFSYTRTELDERLDVYPDIWNAKVRVLVYNGEADACVPWVDNEGWVRSLNFTVTAPWAAWTSNEQVAGYEVRYTSPSGSPFDFATVKGAGHMVPQFRPAEAWTMFSQFIAGQPLTAAR